MSEFLSSPYFGLGLTLAAYIFGVSHPFDRDMSDDGVSLFFGERNML